MEARDIELLEKYIPQNSELETLWNEHVLFEKQLDKLESKPFLTPDQEKSVRELKKQKLDGKTRLQIILDQYREE